MNGSLISGPPSGAEFLNFICLFARRLSLKTPFQGHSMSSTKQPQPTERLDAPRESAGSAAHEPKSSKTASFRPTHTPPADCLWREQPVDAEGGLRLLDLVMGESSEALMGFAYADERFLEFALMPRVAEPVQHHPEGDVGTHMRLVMRRAFELSAELPDERKLRVRLAALCHDLGKVVTGGQRPLPKPDGRWLSFDATDPHHPGHDHLGIELSRELFARLAWPQSQWDFVAQFALYHQAIHQITDRQGQFNRGSASLAKNLFLTPKGERWGLSPLRLALRDEMYSQDFALAAQSDAQGRKMTMEQMRYPQAELMALCAQRAREATRSFLSKPFDETFFQDGTKGIRRAFEEWMQTHPQEQAPAIKQVRPHRPDPRKGP